MSWRRSVRDLRGLVMPRLLEQVAEAADGADCYPCGLQLAPQPVHVNLDGVGADFLVPAVELLGELVLVDDAAASQHQHFEHAELARGQVERLTRERRAPPDCPRRISARTRASSSGRSKGLVM